MDLRSAWTALFYGTTSLLQPGAEIPTGARVTADPAEALTHAWSAASQGTGTPFVYEVGMLGSGAVAVIVDVFIDASLVRQALEIAERRDGEV
jgi:hypothetical protein